MTPMGLLTNAKLWATSKLMRTPGSKQQDALSEVEVSGVTISTQTAGVSKDTQTEDEPKEKEKPKLLKDLTKEENMSVAEKFDLNEGALPFDRFSKDSLLKTNVSLMSYCRCNYLQLNEFSLFSSLDSKKLGFTKNTFFKGPIFM